MQFDILEDRRLLSISMKGAPIDLGSLGGFSASAYGINDNGQVVGKSTPTDSTISRAFLYDGAMQELSTLSAAAYGINNQGQVVGQSLGHAFLYDGAMRDLGTLDDGWSKAYDVNDEGQVVGASDGRAFLYDGTMRNLGTLYGGSSAAYDINNSDQVVGQSDGRAFLYDGAMRDLGTLPGYYESEAVAINDKGQAAGNAMEGFITTYRAVIYDNGTMRDLGTLPGLSSSRAYDINDQGQVVGYSSKPLYSPEMNDFNLYAFLYDGTGMLNLNDLLPANSEWSLYVAEAINDEGQIVGWGEHNGLRRAFLWSIEQPEDDTITTVVVSPAQSAPAQQVTITATVSAKQPALGTPTGNVVFYDVYDGAFESYTTLLGDGILTTSGGVTTATLSTDELALGHHSITATYTGDAIFNSSTSSPVTKTVAGKLLDMTNVLTSAVPKTLFGEETALTATITPISPDSPEPTGVVNFLKGLKVLGSVPLVASGSVRMDGEPIDLGTLGADAESWSVAYDVNENGQVVGASTIDGWSRAFLYDGTMRDLGTLGERQSWAYGINEKGQVVGESTDAWNTRAFLYDGTMRDLGTLYSKAKAYDINENGQVVGWTDRGAFLYDGAMRDLGPLGRDGATAYAMNDSGLVAGAALTPIADSYAFLYDDGDRALRGLGTLPDGLQSWAYGVNSRGQVVGESMTPTGYRHAFLYDGATMRDLGTLAGGRESRANDINDQGLVVGTSDARYATSYAFLYDGTRMVNLNDLLPSDSDWWLLSAEAINDQGQIVGQGIHNGVFRAFLWNIAQTDGAATEAFPGQWTATLTTRDLPVGNHWITANYYDEGIYKQRQSNYLKQSVAKAATETTLRASVNPSVFGQKVTLTATVSASVPGAGALGGKVTFMDGGRKLGTGVLITTDGVTTATLTTGSLAVGNRVLKAIYTGDRNHTASGSSVAAQTVYKAETGTSLRASVNPSTLGQKVTLTATVGASAPGAGAPTGIVTFLEGGKTLGKGMLRTVKGVTIATFSTTKLSAGSHTITASYRGNGKFNASAAAFTQAVLGIVTVDTLVTNNAAPQLTGAVRADWVKRGVAGVTVVVGGQTLAAAVSGGTWSVTVPAALADGTYDVLATVKSKAGRTQSDATTGELAVDTVKPSVTVAALVTDQNQPVLSGTVSDAGPSSGMGGVTVVVGGQTLSATIGGGTWSVAVPAALADGAYNVQVTATDRANNSATDATTGELTVDTRKPTVTVTALITSDNMPTISGTVSDAEPSSGIAGITVVVGGQTLSATISGGTWSAVVPNALADGVYDVQVTATDKANNSATDTTTGELTVDTQNLTVTVATLIANSNTPTISGTVGPASEIAGVTVVVGGQTFAATVSGAAWTAAVPTALADGVYDVQVTATDRANNSATDATSGELTVDTQYPTLTVGTLITNNDMPTLSGTVSDAEPSSGTSGVTVTVGGQTLAATVSGAAWSVAVPAALLDGLYDVEARVNDMAGNGIIATLPSGLIVDTVGPVVTVDPLSTNTTAPIISGTVTDPEPSGGMAALTVVVNGQPLVRIVSGGLWTAEVPAALLDGAYDVQLTATDRAGNVVNDATTDELTIDTVQPVVTVDSLSTANNMPTLSGTVIDEAPNSGIAEVSVVVGGQTLAATVSGAAWSVTLPVALPDGIYDVQATADDGSGNTAADTTAGELTVDTAPPPIADADLEAAVRDTLGLPEDHRVSRTDLLGLASLVADASVVTSLSGLEYATNLQSLSFLPSDWSAAGDLGDLSPLSDLSNLRSLSLVGVGISDSDLSALGSLSGLESLDLRYNAITDVSALASLPALSRLEVYGNLVTDLSPLAGKLLRVDLPDTGADGAQSIAELAQSLHELPIAIFEYVVNNFEYQPYAGAKKGPLATLQTRSGNDWDLDALLAALLNEAGIATRYVSGRIEVPTETTLQWLGVTDPDVAGSVLASAGLNAVRIIDANEQPVAFRFDHAWVQAQVPDGSGGQRWVDLDPSWKFKDYRPGVPDIASLVPFDAAGYLSRTRSETPSEYYEFQVADYLAANRPDVSLADVAYDGPIRTQVIDVLPAALPYTVEETTATYTQIPDVLTYRMGLTLKDGGGTLWQQILVLPQMSLERVTIGYADAGGIELTPQLLVGGQVVVQGPTVAEGDAVYLFIDHYEPGSDAVFSTEDYQRRAGQYIAVGIEAGQITGAYLARQQAVIDAAAVAARNGQPVSDEDQVGALLALGVASYFHNYDQAARSVDALTHALPVYFHVASGLATGDTTVAYNWDLQNPAIPQGSGVTVDIGSDYTWQFAIDGSTTGDAVRYEVIGYDGSAQEHAVWEQILNIPGISAVKSLQLANERGIPIFTIDSQSAADLIPQLTLDAGTIEGIQAKIDAGNTVTVPRDPTPLGTWQGVGYIALGGTGGGYIISGGLRTQSPTILQGGSITSLTPKEIEELLLYLKKGDFTYVGDPINVATGNVVHDETDLSLPGIEPDLTFQRHYNSQDGIDDTGMGIGWSHSFSDKLWRDAANDSYIWSDSQGMRSTFMPDGQGGYITPPSLHGTFGFYDPEGVRLPYFRSKDGLIRMFGYFGELIQIADRNNNAINLGYDYDADYGLLLTSVYNALDPALRLTFTWTGNHITAITDSTGRRWTYAYTGSYLTRVDAPSDAQTPAAITRYDYTTTAGDEGLLRQITEPNGGRTQFTYYNNRRGRQVTDPAGYKQTVSYDLFKNETTFTDERGNRTIYKYNPEGNLIVLTYPDRSRESFAWENGLKKSSTDVFGQIESYQYDTLGNMTRLTDRAGNVTTYVYEPAFSNVTSVTEPGGRVTTYAYDARGNRTRITDALGNVATATYDSRGLVLTQTSPRGNQTGTSGDFTTTYSYNTMGLVLTRSTDLPSTESYTYDSRGRRITARDALGNTTTYTYDLRDRLLRTTDPLGGISTKSYDAMGNVTASTDALGRTTRYSYDLRQNVVRIVNPDGTFRATVYDPAYNPVRETDELGRATLTRFDNRNRPYETVRPDGKTSRVQYDRGGRAVAITDPMGNVARFYYDTLGRLATTVDALGQATWRNYDVAGNMVSITDPLGRTTQYAYDLLNRRTSATDPLGNVTATTYDANGNVVSVRDPLSHVTSYAYDVRDRQSSTTDALGRTSAFGRDAAGNLASITDPLGRRSQYAYDALGRQTSVTDALNQTTTLVYDAVGNVTSATDALGRTTSFTYDARNRRVSSTDALGQRTTWSYDAAGNVRSTTDPLRRTTWFGYDLLGRQTSVTDPLFHATTTTYDANGNILRITDALGRTTQSAYDKLNRRTSRTDAMEQTTAWTYDAMGNVLSMTDPAGNTTGYAYDAANRKIYETDALGQTQTFSYDAAGNLLSIADPLGRATQFTYDALNRRTSLTDALDNTTTTAYDAAGNVVSLTDALGRTTAFAYDALNRRTSVTDALNKTTTTAYDAVGNVVSLTDALGRTTAFAYDALNRRTSSTDALGEATLSAYDAVGNVVSTTDPLGRATRFGYDRLNRRTSVTDALNNTTKTAYDAVGNVVSATDALGRKTSFAYDALNRRTSSTNALGQQTRWDYDAVGNVVSTTDALGRATRFMYDAIYRQTSVTDALDNTTATAYDAVGNVVSVTDALGRTATFGYDRLNRQISLTDPLNNTATTAYDAVGNVVSVTDALGHATTFGYDRLNRRISVTDALNTTTTSAYDAVGNVVSLTDALGRITSFAYDAINRRTSSTDALGQVTRSVYDAVGNVVSITDPLGRATRFAYDSLSRRTSVVDPLDNTTTTAYDAVGNVVSVADALGHTTSFGYDRLNRQTSGTDALGQVTRWTYDAAGNVRSATDPLGRATRYAFDRLNRRTSVVDPLNHATQSAYDAVGNVVSVTDALGHATTYAYDALKRRTTSTDALGEVTRWAYDAVGNLVSLADPAANATVYAYDSVNRRISETSPLGSVRTYAYDAVGNLTRYTDRNGRTTRSAYDALDRLTTEEWLDGAGAPIRSFAYSYDAAGQLIGAGDPDSSYAYNFDLAGRLTAVDNQATPGVPRVVLSYAYDAAGNRISVADSNGGVGRGDQAMSYDALNRLTRVTQTGSGVADKRVDLSYDAASRLQGVSRFADRTGTALVAASAYVYDAAGRLTQLSHTQGAETLAQYQWTFDAANRITRETNADGTRAFAYDDADQLTSALNSSQPNETYNYGPNGNRTAAGYATGEDNRMLSDGTYSYAYDAEGNLTRRTEIATGDFTEYTWDYRNRLTRVVSKNASGTVTGQSDYTYDINNRRIAVSVDPDGAGSQPAATDRFVYDGDNVALQFDASGEQTHRYLSASAVDQIFADEGSTGEVSWMLTDHQASVRDVVDSSGASLNHIRYDAFGRIVAESNPAASTLFAYAGGQLDRATGLQYHRARYYDPGSGRFVSQDPLSFAAGDANLYRYVRNNTPNLTDPSGLRPSRDARRTIEFMNNLERLLQEASYDVFMRDRDLAYLLDPSLLRSGRGWRALRRQTDEIDALLAQTAVLGQEPGGSTLWRMRYLLARSPVPPLADLRRTGFVLTLPSGSVTSALGFGGGAGHELLWIPGKGVRSYVYPQAVLGTPGPEIHVGGGVVFDIEDHDDYLGNYQSVSLMAPTPVGAVGPSVSWEEGSPTAVQLNWGTTPGASYGRQYYMYTEEAPKQLAKPVGVFLESIEEGKREHDQKIAASRRGLIPRYPARYPLPAIDF